MLSILVLGLGITMRCGVIIWSIPVMDVYEFDRNLSYLMSFLSMIPSYLHIFGRSSDLLPAIAWSWHSLRW